MGSIGSFCLSKIEYFGDLLVFEGPGPEKVILKELQISKKNPLIDIY